MSRRSALSTAILLAAWLAAPPAFSADEKADTTAPPGLAPTTVVTPLRDPAAGPPPPGDKPTADKPASDKPASDKPGEERKPIAQGPKPHVALVLPIGAPGLGRLADAVRQGFLAGAEAEGKRAPPIRVHATADDNEALLAACAKAREEGALLVVAGLTRGGATSLARSDCSRRPVLALNEPQDADMPPAMYAISLSTEQDARQVAAQAVNDGWQAAIVIGSPSPLATRTREAFEREFGRAAGEIRRVTLAGGPDEAPAIKERIATLKGDMVFLALDAPTTRAVRPYISATLPIYTTAMAVDPRAESTVNLELEGVRYADMPWFVQPDHPAVMVYPAPRAPMAVEEERLYALGIDAYRLGTVLLQSDARAFTLDGVTGQITLQPGRHFSRTLVPASIDAGRIVPLAPAR